MRNTLLALAAVGLAISAPLAPALAKQTVAERGEAKLAKMLEGRVAGEPVKCISAFNSHNIEVIDETALVYRTGSTVYVARPTNPKMLGRNDILVTERIGSQLCSNDTMRTVDQSDGFFTGVVFLSDFVPYTKADG